MTEIYQNKFKNQYLIFCAVSQALGELTDVRLPGATATQRSVPLGSFPLQAVTSEKRNAICVRLRAERLGASAMYDAPLSAIYGVQVFGRPDLRNAMDFAALLLTLPTHSDVSEGEAGRIFGIISGRA